jgi:hypothetical protein
VAASIDSTGDEIAGTCGFMAPEQLRGEPVDWRADIFALGAILQLLVSGGQTRPLRAICQKAMANDAEQRYGDVSALASDVARHLDAQPVSAYRENFAERIARWIRRNAALVTVVAAYIVMRVIVFFWVGR